MVAQLILFVSMPILTHYYLPSAVGHYGYVYSLAMVFLPVLCLRYEFAIPQITNPSSRKSFVAVCLMIVLPVSLVISAAVLIYNRYAHVMSFELSIMFICLVLLLGVQSICNMATIAEGNVQQVGAAKLFQNILLVIVQLGIPLVYGISNVKVLFAGLFLGLLVAILFIFYLLRKYHLISFIIPMPLMRKTLVEHKQLPLLSSWSALLDSWSLSIPILFMRHAFSASLIGSYFLVYRVATGPSILVAKTVSQVITKPICDKRGDRKALLSFFLKISLLLLICSLCLLVCLNFLGDYAHILFGQKWANSKQIIHILMYPICVNLCVSPLSVVFLLLNRNFLGTAWQVMFTLGFLMVSIPMHSYSFYSYLVVIAEVWIAFDCVKYVMMLYIIMRQKNNGKML